MQRNPPPQVPSNHEPGRQARPAGAIRRLTVPQTAPAYDDERDGYPAGDPSTSEGNAGSPAIAAVAPPGPAAGSHDQPGQTKTAGDRLPGPGAPAPEPDGWPRQFAQVVAETLAGARPAHQLTPWLTAHARRRIRQLAPALATGQRPRVRRVMTSAPASDVLELTAVIGFGQQVRALALRLERDRSQSGRPGGGWCCTTIESA
jgi:Family of unknown function (DUF6459)